MPAKQTQCSLGACLGRPLGNSSGSGGGMRGMMPGSEQPVASSAATENKGSQSAKASTAQEYARDTSGATRPRKMPLGARMSVLVPSSDDQEGPATRRPPQKNV